MTVTKRQAKAHLAFWGMRLARGILASRMFVRCAWYARNVQRRGLAKVKAYERRFDHGRLLPESIEIELTNRCNLHCLFCPNGSHHRKRGTMSFETFKNIVDGAQSNGVEKFVISGFGECLLDKDIIDKLAYLRKMQAAALGSVELVTNGTLLNMEVSGKIVEDALATQINVSIDAGNADTYRRIHGGGEFEKIIDNLSYLQRVKRAKGLTVPAISVRFKDFHANNGQFGRFVERLSAVADEIKPYANIFEWPESNLNVGLIGMDRSIRVACPNLWMAMRINWNGEVVLCCQDYEGEVILGNVNTETLKDIWNNERIMSYRARHERLRFNGLKICDQCNINTHLVIPW